MKAMKVNFTMPEDVVAALKGRVGERSRSAFVTAAVLDRLHDLEQEELKQTLIEGYLARRDEDAEVSKEWEAPNSGGMEMMTSEGGPYGSGRSIACG